MNSGRCFLKSFAISTPSLFVICFFTVATWASSPAARGTSFAQKLVESTRTKHPEVREIGISARSSRGCHTIASTDPGDVGEKCEKEDSAPIDTGKPVIEKEEGGFAISLPLHDIGGKTVGSVGIEFKSERGQTESAALAKAKKIAAEMETQISSKKRLYEHGE